LRNLNYYITIWAGPTLHTHLPVQHWSGVLRLPGRIGQLSEVLGVVFCHCFLGIEGLVQDPFLGSAKINY